MNDPSAARSRSLQFNLELVAGLSRMLDFSSWVLVSSPAGRHIMHQGEVVQRVPLVVSGTLDAVIHSSSDDGNAVVPVTFGPGELAMISYLFTDDRVTVDVVVSKDATFRLVPVDAIERCLLRSHELLVLLVRYQSCRLREVQAREKAWLERGVHQRVCARLARISFGLPPNKDGHAVIVATHEALAARCGVSRPRLSKELKVLEDEGRVKLGRGTIEIIDQAWFDAAAW